MPQISVDEVHFKDLNTFNWEIKLKACLLSFLSLDRSPMSLPSEQELFYTANDSIKIILMQKSNDSSQCKSYSRLISLRCHSTSSSAKLFNKTDVLWRAKLRSATLNEFHADIPVKSAVVDCIWAGNRFVMKKLQLIKSQMLSLLQFTDI